MFETQVLIYQCQKTFRFHVNDDRQRPLFVFVCVPSAIALEVNSHLIVGVILTEVGQTAPHPIVLPLELVK